MNTNPVIKRNTKITTWIGSAASQPLDDQQNSIAKIFLLTLSLQILGHELNTSANAGPWITGYNWPVTQSASYLLFF